MFSPFDSELIGFLQEWTDVATSSDIGLISQILKEAPASLVFDHQPFVIRFLARAQFYGNERLDGAINALVESAVSGVRTGVLGNPSPQDLALKEDATNILKITQRFSPSYQLYDRLRKYAEQCIEWSLRNGERYEVE